MSMTVTGAGESALRYWHLLGNHGQHLVILVGSGEGLASLLAKHGRQLAHLCDPEGVCSNCRRRNTTRRAMHSISQKWESLDAAKGKMMQEDR